MPTSDIKKGPLYVDSTNNRVGIGTTSPSALIHASGAAASGGAVEIRLEDTAASSNSRLMRTGSAYSYAGVGANETWLYHAGAGTINIGPDGGGVVKIVNNGSERLRIDSSGNVGIGESNPVAKTHIQGSGTSGQVTASLILENLSSGTAGMDITGSAGSSRLRFLYGGGPSTGTNTLNEAINIVLEGSNAGNVGIGTSSPAATLHITDSDTSVNGTMRFGSNSTYYAYIKKTYSTDKFDIGTNGSGQHISFTNNGTEAMRISVSGNLLVGTTNETGDGQGLELRGDFENGGFVQIKKSSSSVSGNKFISFARDGSVIGSVSMNGTTAVAYNTSSDYRLKTAVNYDWDATTRLKQLRPARFEWISDGDNAVPVDGFLAHEVQDVVPEAVTGTHNEVDDDGNPVYQGIDQSKLTPLLTKALIEAVEKIEQLETRIAALEAN